MDETLFYGQPKMAMAMNNLKISAAEEEENWENDLVEHSYNPVEVKRRKGYLQDFYVFVCRLARRRTF